MDRTTQPTRESKVEVIVSVSLPAFDISDTAHVSVPIENIQLNADLGMRDQLLVILCASIAPIAMQGAAGIFRPLNGLTFLRTNELEMDHVRNL